MITKLAAPFIAQSCRLRRNTCSFVSPRTRLQRPLIRRRYFSHDALLTILTPPAILAGLGLTLWAYKCLMMVIFQNKIIYMPSVPPFSRREKVEDYEGSCKPFQWRHESLRSSDGTRLSACISETSAASAVSGHNVIHLLYFQG